MGPPSFDTEGNARGAGERTIKAAVHDRYGPPDVVQVRDVERPVPTDDQVLVRVHAASVNRADLDGMYPRFFFVRFINGLRAPRNGRIGLDVAGVVESVGPNVTRFKPGDRVFADMYLYGSGAYAEFVCAPDKAFASIPADMSFEDAATLPHSAILAMQGLRRRDGRPVRPGDKVLIVGASGNVGPFAVQIAKAQGADVTGVCSTGKMDFVRSLGADHVIDYTTTDYTRTGERYDWILDVDGHNSVLRCRHALRPNGVYANLGGSTPRIFESMLLGPLVGKATGRSIGLVLWWKPFDLDDVATLLALIEAGKVKPVIDTRLPLSKVAEGLRIVDEGRARGKVIITV